MGWNFQSVDKQVEHWKLLNRSRWKEEEELEEEEEAARARSVGKTSVVLSFTCASHLPPLFCSFSRCLHNGQMDSVKRASPNVERLLRTHRPSAQMSAMRMDRDRKSWHSWESSSTGRMSAVRAMIRDAVHGQHWTVILLLSLALQPQVSRRLRAIFSHLV